jgi:UDP-N-acetylmuramoyl-tripeptide--D-alanyl-D-alanine ligase
VIIDGRQAAPGDLYVAVRGERFDGHGFCAQAVAAGATGVLIEKDAPVPATGDGTPIDAFVIAVPASAGVDGGRAALGAIARWHRRRWGAHPDAGPVIGVTGSAGKTTTKELIAAALSSLGRVHATRGSLNNETGVPLTLLGLQRYHDAAVIEMGMRGLGQIEYLARMAEPDVGVVVNAGIAHVGVVGSADDIARGKAELFACLGSEGTAVYPAGDARLESYAAGAARSSSFGVEAENPAADVTLVSYQLATRKGAADAAGADSVAGANLVIAAQGKKQGVFLRLVGVHNAINATCAVAAALAAGVDLEQAVIGLARARPADMRGEIIDIAGRRVLIDCYNANPASMSAALATLADLCASTQSAGVAVLGDMLELGDSAAGAHRDAGALASRLGIAVIALGELGAHMVEGAGGQRAADPPRATRAADPQRATRAADIESAARAALGRTRPGDWILIKASRGMRLERVVAAMRATAVPAAEPTIEPAAAPRPTRTEGP